MNEFSDKVNKIGGKLNALIELIDRWPRNPASKVGQKEISYAARCL